MGKSTSLIEYAKRLGIEIPNTTASPLDIEAGKAGYEKYLADLEAAKNEKKANEYQPKNKFEKFIIKLSQAAATSGSENPTMQGLNNAITAMREDDSYMRPSDEWSDEERWAFGEKYAQNADDAFAFATELNNSKAAEKKRKQQEALARWTKQNAATRVLGTASSLGLNATLGGVGYLDALAQRAAGRETIAQHEVLLPHEIANTMQGSVATHLNDKYGTINDDVWLLGGKGVGDIYGLGMSMGQSALGAATGGSTGTLVQFFGMAASNGVTDALERGATADQALAFGTISGAAETITEMISVDKLLGITSAKGVQNVFKNVLKQAGQEAGEEFTTAMITNIADNWIMGGKSQFYAIVNQLVASGMDPEEAKKKAWLQTIEGIAYDTLAGALSGGISGAGATAINRGVNQFGLTKNARTANAQALETYTPIQNDLIAEGKQHKTSEKIATKMESKLAKGKELSGYDLRTLAYETQNAQRTADVETVRKAIIEKMKAEGLDESKAKSLGEIALNKAIGHEVSKLQETKLKNNEIASKVYRQISEEMMDSGVGDSAWAEETPIRQLRSEFKAQKAAEEAALRPKVTESPEVVAKNQEIAAKKQRLEALKDDIISRYGLKDKNYKISRASVDKVLTENKGQNAYKPKKGSKLDVSNINTTLTAKDIINLSNLEAVADALGTKIVAYSSSEQDNGERAYVSKSGEKITANGFFLTESGDIGIDIHAGINGEGVVLYTAAHEIAHEIKQVSEEHFDALEKVVTKTLINEGYSIESLLEIQRNKLIKEGQTPEKLGRQQFEALAREEMVADACMSFLASKNAIAEIKALKTENKGLWSVLKKIISKIFGRIDKVYQEVDPYTIEGRAIANARSSIKPVYDAFFSGVKEIARVNKAKAEAKALEKQGIRTEADDLFKVHTSINARSASSGKRSSNENAPNNNQLRADRGTGSGTAQKAERGIPENLSQYSVVQKFKDVSGKTRNVRRLNSQFMVEDTKRKNYLFNTIEDAINAENDSLITRYANKTDHSKSWVKAKVENDPTYLYNKIRFSPRTTVTTGQYEQMKANLSHSKVYSKKSAMELVRKVAPGIRNRSFESLSNQLWEGLNSYTTIDDKRQFAEDMSQIFIDRMTVDTLVKHSEWDAAVEKMAYLKTGIGTIDFRDQDASELKYKLDKKYMSLRSRWGYKKNSDGSFKRAYGLDKFISDLSREMPGMEYLAEMHPAEALLEVDKLYTDLSEQIKEKYESAYDEFSEEEMNEIRQSIAYEIMKAYTDLGDQTKISKYLAEKFEYYQTRIDFWKAENAKTKKISRWHGIISTKALQIKELKKGAFYNATQHHQDIFKDSIETLANIQWRGNLKPTQRISEIFANLKQWYTMNNPMLYSKDADVNLYSDTIATYISKIAETNGAFTEDIYAMVYDVMNHLYTMMRNYNRVFRNGRWEDAPDLVDKYLKIMEETKKNRTALRRIQEGYNTEFLEPMAVAKRADNYNENGFFTQTMEDLRRASINASVGEMNLRKEYDAFVDKNKKYLTNAAKETVSYRGHDIPKIHIIGLYMTMKREHARAGLALNGFEYTIKNKWWDSEDHVYVKGYVTDGDNVTQEMINEATEAEMSTIEKSFTDIDKQYVEILEKLFNEDLKRLKVERDMDRQGYTNAILDYYYPIIRGAMAENIDTAKISDQNRATNASFNKNTVKGARQRLVIISADAMVNRHINDMCKYYYMSQAIENYNVLYNCDVSGNANDPMNIAKLVKETKVWEKDVQYFKKLVSDMQGIRDPQTTAEKALEALRGNYAAFALGLNVKVLFTQFSSMIAAGDVIGFGSILSPKALKITSADIDTYCPLAAVRNYDAAVIKAMSVSDKVGKVSKALTWGIGKVDRLVVRRLFAACQVEAEKRGSGKIGTEENKIAAGKLLEQVIIETQQNSYATERSQAMRSKNEFLKAVTMFTADGMKIVSRMHEAYGEMRAAKKSGDTVKLKKARRKFARSVAVAVNIAVYMTAIACLFNWIYDRDDEEEDENKMLSLTMDTIGNFISALPIISDLYDFMVDGFEVESPMMDTVNNIFSGINNIRKDAVSIMKRDGERSIQDINRDLRTMLYGVGQATGIPFRNAYNLARGIVGNFTRTGGYKLDAKFYETSLASDFEDAIEKGDNYKASYVMSLIYDDRLDKTVSQSQINEIVRLSKLDYSVLPKTIPDEVKRNGKTYVLTATQKDTISSEYAKVTGEIDKLINSSFYRKLSNKDKAYMIDYYHDQYYTRAVNKALKFTNKDTIISDIVGFSKYAELKFLTKDIESDKDENGKTISGSKKEKVIEALKKTSLSEEKRLLYIASLGYSLTDAEKTKLVKYLNSLKLSNSTKEKLADMCGLGYKNGKITAKS